MSEIKSLLKTIVFVQEMDVQVKFYRDVLGLQVRMPAGLNDYSGEYWVEFETGGCTLVLHGGGQKRFGEDAPKMAFEVRDIEAARQAILKRGAKLGEIRSPAPGVQVCDGVDPEGNHFSLDCHT